MFYVYGVHVKDTRELGVVVHTCNPSTWEAETGGWQIGGQPWQLSEMLFQNKN